LHGIIYEVLLYKAHFQQGKSYLISGTLAPT